MARGLELNLLLVNHSILLLGTGHCGLKVCNRRPLPAADQIPVAKEQPAGSMVESEVTGLAVTYFQESEHHPSRRCGYRPAVSHNTKCRHCS